MKAKPSDAVDAPRSLRSVLAFVLPAVIGVALVAGIVAWKQELFVGRTPIFLFTDSALGITKGMPVKVFGFTVGTVREMSIVPGSAGAKGLVRVELDINSEYLQHISKDAKARFAREGVVGQSIIEVLPGNPQLRHIARNETIAFERGKTLNELTEELNRALTPVMTQVKDAIRDLQDPDGRTQKTLNQVTTLLQELPESNRRLQSLLTTADKAFGNVDKAVAGTTSKADEAIDHLGRAAASIESAAPGILQKVDAAADGVARSAEAVRRISESAARKVPFLLDEGENVIRNTGEVVSGAKQVWPLRDAILPTRTTTLNIDSQESASGARGGALSGQEGR